VISEVFRVFQSKLRTSRVSHGYPATAFADCEEIRGDGDG
jgi:hypothetical protein